MEIIKEPYQVKITGKCMTDSDIIQLFNFGFSKENVARRYRKDNKISIQEARGIVEKVLLREYERRKKQC